MTANHSPRQLVRLLVAELLGTALLASVVAAVLSAGSANTSPIYTNVFVPFVAGLALMLSVFLFGWISGAHCNPAVTLGQMVFRKLGVYEGVLYLVAQGIGALLGVRLAVVLLGTNTVPLSYVSTAISIGEFVGALILSFTVSLVVAKKIEPVLAPFAVGLALAMGVALAGVTGGGVLNPALAMAMGATSFVYLLMPIFGGIAGAALAVLLADPAEAR